MQVMTGLIILAVIFAVVAVAAFLIAGRVAAGGPMHAIGKTIRMDEGDRRTDLAARLRWIGFISLVLLAADGVAAYTFVTYVSQ
jgi:hypothetical protein